MSAVEYERLTRDILPFAVYCGHLDSIRTTGICGNDAGVVPRRVLTDRVVMVYRESRVHGEGHTSVT